MSRYGRAPIHTTQGFSRDWNTTTMTSPNEGRALLREGAQYNGTVQMQGAGRRQSTFLLLGQRVVEYLKQHLDELRRPMSSRPLLHDERGHEVAAMKLKVPPRVW